MNAPRPQWRLPIGPGRLGLIVVLALVGAYSVLHSFQLIVLTLQQPAPPDWAQHRLAAEAMAAGESPYFLDDSYRFRWSPIAAMLLVPVTALGPLVWTAAQFAVLGTIPWRLAIIVLLAFPFWADIQAGNILTFTFVAAYHALRGSAVGATALLAGALLVPRPILVPLVIGTLVARPSWRVPFLVAAAASLIGAVATGLHAGWVEMLLLTAGEEVHRMGAHWLPGWPVSGVVIAGILAWAGLPATAGLAVSPYWLTYYGLLPLADRWERVRLPSRLDLRRS